MLKRTKNRARATRLLTKKVDVLNLGLKAVAAQLKNFMPAQIAKMQMARGDIIVLQTDLFLSREQTEILRERMNEQLPGRKVVILTGGLKLSVLTKELANQLRRNA